MLRLLINLILTSALAFEIWLFGLPLIADILLLEALIAIACYKTSVDIALILFSITIPCALTHSYFSIESLAPTLHYRNHEKYVTEDRYQPHVKDTISMPHGDLLAIDPSAPALLAEPREVYFETDSLGYRNRKEFIDQAFVLNGDSFVVGNGMSQENTLSDVLNALGVPNYSIAFPSAPIDYEARARSFLHDHPQNYKFATFYYEGNDFTGDGPTTLPEAPVWQEFYYPASDLYDTFRSKFLRKQFSWLHFPSYFAGMRQRLERQFVRFSVNSVGLIGAGPDLMGFLESQAIFSIAAEAMLSPVHFDPEVLERTQCVFFIPTKYRIYVPLLKLSDAPLLGENGADEIMNPAPGYLALQAAFKGSKVRVVDLTPPLAAAASRAISKHQFVYWRDDTHWNANGIQAVAGTVKECLEGARK